MAFTYALVLEYPERKYILNAGRYFLISTLTFIIGIIFLGELKEEINNRAFIIIFYSGYLPQSIINSQISFNNSAVLFIGLILFGLSAIYFALGVTGLLKKLI